VPFLLVDYFTFLAEVLNGETIERENEQPYNYANHYQLRRYACYAKMRSNELADRMGITTPPIYQF
jgi:hypothetical protein